MSGVDATTVAAAIGLGTVLVWIAVIDMRELRVPDRLSLPLVAAGLALAPALSWQPITAHLIGALGGYCALAAVGALHFRWRGHEGLGLGDAKLFAAGGAWMGWIALPVVLLEAALLGLVFAGLRRAGRRGAPEIPFAPALAIAIWSTWIFGAPGVPVTWR